MLKNEFDVHFVKNLNSWPFKEACRLLNVIKDNKTCRFETGYGPSGLPHIGTFSELARTTYIIRALQKLSDIKTELICFSDDLDPLTKVPDNVVNKNMLKGYIGMPLAFIPDPFGKEKSFGDYMNKKMIGFLDHFGFQYKFFSSVKCYQEGLFDEYLIKVLHKYDEIMSVMLPSLREERRKTYSPFLPICKKTKQILQVKMESICIKTNTITYKDPVDFSLQVVKVTGGECKLQWKPDFGMRWAALDINYEMYGKDHAPNAKIYSKICNILGKKEPIQFVFELFLDEQGGKISKSKGNSISLDDWLKYAPRESLELFLYTNPQRAKRLFFGVISKSVDDYINLNTKYHKTQELKDRLENPLYHIHNGVVPKYQFSGISFSMLLNLASIINCENQDVLASFIKKYNNNLDSEKDIYIFKLLPYAVQYYKDFVKPKKKYLIPTPEYKLDLEKMDQYITCEFRDKNIDPIKMQNYIYSLARNSKNGNIKEYFQNLYQILLGIDNGPRFGSLFALLGYQESKKILSIKQK